MCKKMYRITQGNTHNRGTCTDCNPRNAPACQPRHCKRENRPVNRRTQNQKNGTATLEHTQNEQYNDHQRHNGRRISIPLDLTRIIHTHRRPAEIMHIHSRKLRCKRIHSRIHNPDQRIIIPSLPRRKSRLQKRQQSISVRRKHVICTDLIIRYRIKFCRPSQHSATYRKRIRHKHILHSKTRRRNQIQIHIPDGRIHNRRIIQPRKRFIIRIFHQHRQMRPHEIQHPRNIIPTDAIQIFPFRHPRRLDQLPKSRSRRKKTILLVRVNAAVRR